jgi:hypothetical protein
MKRQEAIKKLQNLYSWEDFYRANQRFEDLEVIREQIEEFKNNYNLK